MHTTVRDDLLSQPALWVVDGYNVVHGLGALRRRTHPTAGPARRALLASLSPLTRRGHEVLVVFDAPQFGETHHGAVRVVYTGGRGGRDADRYIWRTVKDRHPARTVVVSADRKVLTGCRKRALAVLPPKAFWTLVREASA